MVKGLRLTDGCETGPHPDDIADMQGTPLGDTLLMLQLDANVRYAMAQVEIERAKGIGNIFRWLFA